MEPPALFFEHAVYRLNAILELLTGGTAPNNKANRAQRRKPRTHSESLGVDIVDMSSTGSSTSFISLLDKYVLVCQSRGHSDNDDFIDNDQQVLLPLPLLLLLQLQLLLLLLLPLLLLLLVIMMTLSITINRYVCM